MLSSFASLQSMPLRPPASVALQVPDWRSQFLTAFRRCLFVPSGPRSHFKVRGRISWLRTSSFGQSTRRARK
jgi:hypothetical protein